MNSKKWFGRLPALSGAIFAVVGFVRGGGDDSAPTASWTGRQIASYAYHHGIPNALYNVELWTFLALMVFSVVLYSRLRPAEPKIAVAARIVVAACVVSVAIKLGSFPAVYALYSSPVQLDPSVARPLWVIGEFSFTVSMLVQALSLGAVAVSGLLFGGIPRWLAGTAGVIALALAVGFTVGGNFRVAPTLAWMLWLLVASVTLLVRAPRPVSGEQPAPTTLSASPA
jgi:hypothetical protein